MRNHHTKTKGDIAASAVIFDLTKKGYIVSTPLSEHAKYDLIADTGRLVRVQVKYRSDGVIPVYSVWSDKNGIHKTKIEEKDFDYYAIVSGDDYKIAYCMIEMIGSTINFEETNCYNSYYWWEDFSDLSFEKKYKRKTIPLNRKSSERKSNIAWPSDADLKKLIWNEPSVLIADKLGVSDSAVYKHCKSRGIEKPSRGYWAKQKV